MSNYDVTGDFNQKRTFNLNDCQNGFKDLNELKPHSWSNKLFCQF